MPTNNTRLVSLSLKVHVSLQDFDAKHQRALNYEDFDTAAEIRKHRQQVRPASQLS